MVCTEEMMQGWAADEFAEADLGDARRTQRLVDLAETLGQRPTASLPEACGDPATLKAAYRTTPPPRRRRRPPSVRPSARLPTWVAFWVGHTAARRVRAYVPHSAPTRLILICG
jgi:hypothetical protein